MKREETLRYIGNQDQAGGSRHYTLSDGWGRNLRAIDINTGSGLQYTVLPDRGMDISLARYKGINLVYLTPNGETHPAYYEPENLGWLRTFTGGLLTTCGLTWLGSPVVDGTEPLGLHGRYSTIPARQVADLSGWTGDEYRIQVEGTVEEASLFGNKLQMVRRIHSIQGQNSLRISDTITNFGYAPSPYSILYHMNLGYPLLDEDAVIVIDPVHTHPKTSLAAGELNDYKKLLKPQDRYQERVYVHTMRGNANGDTSVILQNKKLGMALSIHFNIRQLPYLIQWKMLGAGEYVLGLEPSNIPLKNRKELKEENILPLLQPGESVTNEVQVVLTDL